MLPPPDGQVVTLDFYSLFFYTFLCFLRRVIIFNLSFENNPSESNSPRNDSFLFIQVTQILPHLDFM